MISCECLKTLNNITFLSADRNFRLLSDPRASSLDIDLTVLLRVNHWCSTFRWIEDILRDWNLLTNERPLKRAEEFAFAILAVTDCTQRHGRRGDRRVTG